MSDQSTPSTADTPGTAHTGPSIERLGPDDIERILAAGHLFDEPPTADLAADFVARAGHHLLVVYVGGQPAGFVSGVEVAHPDKKVEMLVYELGVDETFRRRGVASRLLDAMTRLADERGCRNLWVLTEPDNDPALATYRSRGATEETSVLFEWVPGPPA